MIAISGRIETAGPVIDNFGVDRAKVPLIIRDMVAHASPIRTFPRRRRRAGPSDRKRLRRRRQRLGHARGAARDGALGVGLLSRGYGEDELVRASAFRVYAEPADLLAQIDELDGRS
jgi:hypothetical protein